MSSSEETENLVQPTVTILKPHKPLRPARRLTISSSDADIVLPPRPPPPPKKPPPVPPRRRLLFQDLFENEELGFVIDTEEKINQDNSGENQSSDDQQVQNEDNNYQRVEYTISDEHSEGSIQEQSIELQLHNDEPNPNEHITFNEPENTENSNSSHIETNNPTGATVSPEGIVWRKSPDAEKIKQLILQDIDREVQRKTVSLQQEVVMRSKKGRQSSVGITSSERIERRASTKNKVTDLLQKKMLTRSGREATPLTKAKLEELAHHFTSESTLRGGAKPSSLPRSASEPQLPEDCVVDKRLQTVLEIRSSEASYVGMLEILKNVYMNPLLQFSKDGHLDIDQPTIKRIFSNLTLIYNVNVRFLEELGNRLQSWDVNSTIGDIFLEITPYFKIYQQYGNNYSSSLAQVQECSKNNNFVQLLALCQSQSGTQLNLEALLITPIQRIPRYILLLNEIYRSTSEDHPDHNCLKDAIPQMQAIANNLNSNISVAEQSMKFMKLSQEGASALLEAHRSLVYEATIRCENKKKNICFYLFSDILVHLSDTKAKNKINLTMPQSQLPLHLVWINKKTYDNEYYWEIIGPSSICYRLPTDDTVSDKLVDFLFKSLLDHVQKHECRDFIDIQSFSPPPITKSLHLDHPVRYGSYTFLDQISYHGFWYNGLMHGTGTWKFFGNEYTGDFVNNKKNGKGEMSYFSGERYSGDWMNDLPHGEGKLVTTTGDVYEGKWERGAKHGEGVLTYHNGDVYNGTWKENKHEGFGILTYSNGVTYTGHWENGRFHYYGVLSCSKTSIKYEGEWVNGFKEGKGKMIYPDTSFYEGFWKNGLREGYGVYESKNEGKYEGEWVADMKCKKGTMEFISGNVYTGNWKNGMFHALGKMIYVSGSIQFYDGEWHSNKKQGKGTLVFRNGDIFEGQFQNDMIHGNGQYTFSNGVYLEGKWNKGKLDGKVTVHVELQGTRRSYVGTYKDNEWVSENGVIPNIHFHLFPDSHFDTW